MSLAGTLVSELKLRAIRPPWSPCYRLIPSRFPPIDLFESVAAPEDFEALYELESLTNPRLSEEVGRLDIVAPEDRVLGAGSSPVMAAFTHPPTVDIRFSGAGEGAYYGARELDTAIAESRYHRERYLRAVAEPPGEISVRCYIAELVKPLHDGRRKLPDTPYMDPGDYGPSVTLGKALRNRKSWGLLYPSVRDPGGQCVVIFRPPAIQVPVTQGPHYRFIWDGEAIAQVFRTELVE